MQDFARKVMIVVAAVMMLVTQVPLQNISRVMAEMVPVEITPADQNPSDSPQEAGTEYGNHDYKSVYVNGLYIKVTDMEAALPLVSGQFITAARP